MHVHGLIFIGILPAKCIQLEMTQSGFCFTGYVFLTISSAYPSLYLKKGKKHSLKCNCHKSGLRTQLYIKLQPRLT